MNKIKNIPPSICNLHKLKELYIENTSISVILKEIGQLKNLSVLDISNNKILENLNI
ncbi:hypothetical protein [Clostridium sp. DJ247]|uniref:hypothetical protein n=1 Tax=Clostridium sp. DJ247 TaxID=2726188 RepID=UPI001624DE08|nr:hypothetical protein [Clostridium sp. DJ247]